MEGLTKALLDFYTRITDNQITTDYYHDKNGDHYLYTIHTTERNYYYNNIDVLISDIFYEIRERYSIERR